MRPDALSHVLAALLAAALATSPAPAQDAPPPIAIQHGSLLHSPAAVLRSAQGVTVIRLDQDILAQASVSALPIAIEGFPLPDGGRVTLRLDPFTPIEPTTRFVIAGENGIDRSADFDPRQVLCFRGSVENVPGSSVFLSVAPGSVVGRVDLGAGKARALVSHRGRSDAPLNDGELAVFAPSTAGGVSLDVPMCTVTPPAGWVPPPAPPPGVRDNEPIRGLRQVELAIETDYEYYELFNDQTAALIYLTQLYAQVSDIYIRDLNLRVDISYMRLWTTPTDPYSQEDPLNQFAALWESNMKSVKRDVAQLFLGSRFLNAGGVAYAPALCNSSSYSWAGYALGYFSDPDRPSWAIRDIMVTAHELGHNCGTYHTHDYGLDNCDDALSHPQRGSIMAYCGQTYSGGDANHDLWFHEYTAQQIRNYIQTRTCIAPDCNQNHQPDSQDIALGASKDLNANGIPDECEDCNSNGVFDALDISSGTSPDVDSDGIPDECEPDCNSDGVPDHFAIQLGISVDFNANRLPDDCEPDRDANLIADYTQIHGDMTLDKDRDLVLDSLQDCDGNGVTDLAQLDHAWNAYVATTAADASVREFVAASGVLLSVHQQGLIADGQDLLITPWRTVLVSSGAQSRVAELSASGQYLRDLVAPGAGGLSIAGGMLLRADQNTLLVASRGTNSVLEYSLTDGSLVRTVVAPSAGGLSQPFGLAIHGDGLYVSTGDAKVLAFDLATGAPRGVFVSAGSGTMSDPRGILFKPDGNLLVASRGTSRINEYSGVTGAFIRKWNRDGTSNRLTLDQPWCLRLGPDGGVYCSRNLVTREGHDDGDDDEHGDDDHVHDIPDDYYGGPTDLHLTDARVYEFDVRTGNFVRSYILGSDTGLYRPTGFDFMPGQAADCNQNHIPDACDIASGTSLDRNLNGLPDECEPHCLSDFDHSMFVDTEDFDAFVFAFEAGDHTADVDASGFVDTEDFDAFVHAFEAGC